MTTNKPTILLVHGGWHTPAHFVPFRALLQKAGYPSRCPTLACVEAEPPVGLMEDAQVVRDELEQLVVEEEKDVIVIGHSYGGLVVTQGVDAEFSRKSRQASGKKGGVLHLIYVCALIVPVGESVLTAMGWSSLPPFAVLNERGQLPPMQGAEQAFYSDLPPEEQAKWVAELRPMSSAITTVHTTFAAHAHYPVSYLYSENDMISPVATQQGMVRKVKEKCGSQVKTFSCTAAHSAFLSQPDVVLGIIEEIA